MKKIVFVFMLIGLSTGVWAQRYAEIKGFVKNDRLKEVQLYRTVDGAISLYATTMVAADGSYGFSFCPEAPGFYTVGDKDMSFVVYVKGGDQVNLDVLENKAELKGKNTAENKALYRWQDYSDHIRLKSVYFYKTSSTYEDFFPEFKTFVAGLPDFRAKLKSNNKVFDEMLQKMIDYETDYYAMLFLRTPRTKHPRKSDWPEYYNSILSDQKYVNDEVLQFPLGVRMLSVYGAFAHQMSGQPHTTPEGYSQACMDAFKNDRLKGEFILQSAFTRYKSYDQYLRGMEEYDRYLVTPSLKTRAEAIGTKLYDTREGGMAADFTYPDVNGKEVSLSDFKGKVVVVDVWATWCGPCRGEIPHLKKLEEELHGTDVVFIGVSVDEPKDKQKWLDFIQKEQLGGVQLLASGWSKITKDYKIKGIPRFMVFDRKGNIVSVDAPRPSSPELKQLLEKELKKESAGV